MYPEKPPSPSPRLLTFVLPSENSRSCENASSSPDISYNAGGHNGISQVSSTTTTTGSSPNNFLNRLSRRISQSGANLKRKVSSKSGSRTGPIRRASEADKENRSIAVYLPTSSTLNAERGEKQSNLEGREVEKDEKKEKPRKATLKRGLRVSVMRRSKSEGASQEPEHWKLKSRTENRENEMERMGELAGDHLAQNEVLSEVSSHRGSYFYSNSLGVCWDGSERVHPDAFAFAPYSSNCDVVPVPVTTDSRVVYASTLSSFPPRPPLRPRTPPQLTPASQIAADYRALHPRTPSVYSFSDFDTPPVDPDFPQSNEEHDPSNASPAAAFMRTNAPRLDPINTVSLDCTKGYNSSTHSSTASSRPSDTFCEPLTPVLSEGSATSLESLARGNMLTTLENTADRALKKDEWQPSESQGFHRSRGILKYSLVDSKPVSLLRAKPSTVFSDGSSTVETWRDCE